MLDINEDNFIEIVDPLCEFIHSTTIDHLVPNHPLNPYHVTATYGTDELFYDVTSEVIFCFKNYDQLIILKEYGFNDYFGDPHFGQVKKLTLKINNQTYIIEENRTTNFEFDLFGTTPIIPIKSITNNSLREEIITI